MEEVRKRRQLKPEEKLQIYKEATVARAQGNGSVAEVLRRWGIHSSNLTRITKTVEEGAIVQFKMNRSRKARVVYSEEEMLRWKAERERLERGLKIGEGLLYVIDGSKGLRKAIYGVFGNRALIQRCQWHERENVVSYLPKSMQAGMRRKLQVAYQEPAYERAKEKLLKIRKELQLINQSAVSSLDEGLEETLALHRLGLFRELGISLKTTNCIESLMALIGQKTNKVDYWKNSDQKHRWLATALLDIEPRLRKVKGYRYLPQLRTAIQREIEEKKLAEAA
jgi:transposase-like protein